MAVPAAALVLIALGALAVLYVSTMSRSLTDIATKQGLAQTRQLAEGTKGGDPQLLRLLFFSDDGLDGVALFRRDGSVEVAAGDRGSMLRKLSGEARAAIREHRAVQRFVTPAGHPTGALRPWTPSGTTQVTVVPRGDGALAAAYPADQATADLRSTAWSVILSVAAGTVFVSLALLLLLRRLVTRPVERLADEVSHLGGDEELRVGAEERGWAELGELATGISDMREHLRDAQQKSTTDPLTGIANHRAFHERLDEALLQTRADSSPLSLVALDVDNLKQVNDRCGHAAGDRLLRAVAGALRGACRDDDLCARLGGDEFAVICAGADGEAAKRVAARISASVEAIPASRFIDDPRAAGSVQISASVGVAEVPGDADTKEELIKRADEELYAAKAAQSRKGPLISVASARAEAKFEAMAATVRALAMAVDAKDSGTRSHCETVASYATSIAERVGLDGRELESLRRAAFLHDVGKIGTPDSVLTKPGKLTDEEYEVMKEHSTLGYRIVLSVGLPEREALWVLHHHERYDGRGYPHGLSGQQIPLQSRILLVADAFEAMTADRPYRTAMPVTDAMAELHSCAGTQFDAQLVGVMAEVVAELEDPAGPLPDMHAPSAA